MMTPARPPSTLYAHSPVSIYQQPKGYSCISGSPQGGKPSFLVMLIHETHAMFTPSETEGPAPRPTPTPAVNAAVIAGVTPVPADVPGDVASLWGVHHNCVGILNTNPFCYGEN